MLTKCRASDLKPLRLVCKAFAANYSILKRLFDNIGFVIDVTWLDKLSKVNLTKFAPFVRSMTLVPPLHNWQIDFETFKHLFDDRNYDHIPKTFSLSKKTAYARYKKVAERNRALLEDQGSVLVIKIVKLLGAFPRCLGFSFAQIDYTQIGNDLSTNYPNCLEIADPRTRERLDLIMYTRHVPDLAFGLALEAMRRAHVRPRCIEVKHPVLGHSLWQSNLRHELLDLQQVTIVNFAPEPAFENLPPPYIAHVYEDFVYVLSRCASTIEVLQFEGFDTHTQVQPTENIQAMPKLGSLMLGPCDVPSSFLVKIISTSTKMHTISLHDVDLADLEPPERWRDVFEAIRSHPNSIDVEFDSLYIEGFEVFMEKHRTHRPIQVLRASDARLAERFSGECPVDAVTRILPLFLDGKIDWVGALKDFFENW